MPTSMISFTITSTGLLLPLCALSGTLVGYLAKDLPSHLRTGEMQHLHHLGEIHEVDLLCLVAKQLNNKLGLPSNKAYAYVSSLLWRGVQLQLLLLSKPIHDIESVVADIAYWRFELLKLRSIIVELVEIRHHCRLNMQLDALTTALDVLTQDKHALQKLVQVHAMSKLGEVSSLSPTKLPLTLASHCEMPISSPIPTTTQERGGDHQSMSVVYTSTTLPPTSSSHLHHHHARLGEVPTLPVYSSNA